MEIRLIDENGIHVGIVDFDEANKRAKELNLDLIKYNNDNPPLYKIMDYGKFKYEQGKKQKQLQKKQFKNELKNIKIRYAIAEHDLNYKIKQIIQFIQDNYKVKLSVVLKGRENIYKELAKNIIDKIYESIQNIAKIDKPINIENNSVSIIFSKK